MGKMYQSLQDKPHDVAERLRAELNQVLQRKPDNPDQVILSSNDRTHVITPFSVLVQNINNYLRPNA